MTAGKRNKKTIRNILVSLLCAGLITLAIAPTLLSTPWGKEKLLQALEKTSGWQVSADKLRLSWLGPQIGLDLRITDPIRGIEFKAAKLHLSSSLFTLLLKKFPMGSLEVENGSLVLNQGDLPPLSLEEVNISALIPLKKVPIHAQAVGLTRQGDATGQFSMNLDLESLDAEPRLSIDATFRDFPLAILAPFLSLPDDLLATLGPSLDLDLKWQTLGQTPLIHLQARGQTFSAKMEMQFQEGQLTLQRPALFEMEFENSPLTLTLNELNLPLKENRVDWTSLSSRGHLRAHSFVFKQKTIQDLNLQIETSHLSEKIFLDLSGFFQNTPLKAHLEIQNPLHSPGLDWQAENLPTLLIPWEEPLLLALLGDEFSSQGHFEDHSLQLTLSSPFFTLDEASFTTQKGLDLKTPFRFTFTPKNLTVSPLHGRVEQLYLPFEDPLSLKLKTDFSLSQLNFSLLPFPLHHLDVELDIDSMSSIKIALSSPTLKTSGHFSWQEKEELLTVKGPIPLYFTLTNEEIAAIFKNLSLQKPAYVEASLSPFAFKLDGTLTKPLEGHLTIRELKLNEIGTLERLTLKGRFDPESKDLQALFSAHASSGQFEGTWASKDKAIDAHLNVYKFPVHFLELTLALLGQKNLNLPELLGDTLSGKASLNLQDGVGPLNLSLQAPHARLTTRGSFKEGMLHLEEDLHFQASITPALTRLLFKETNPLTLSDIRAEAPLTLEISASGTSIPLFPFRPEALTIPKARIELGQITCDNAGNLHVALGMLKQSLSKGQDLHLWFTPIYLHIEKGKIEIERTDILIDHSLEICSWGQINLVKDRVNMVLGLTSQALKKAFGIKDLPPDYVLQLPMKGTLDNVKIDSGKASAKITALMIWQKSNLAGAVGGGVPGAIIGELVGKLATLPDYDNPAPPAKRPFPWNEKKLSHKEETTPQKTCRIKKEDSPAKQLLKFLF